MGSVRKRSRSFVVITMSIIMGGCASTPTDRHTDVYDMLYQGESTVAYGTAFPVASPDEGYRNGDRAARAGDFDRALYEYIRGLQLEEKAAAEPLYKIGSIHHRQGNHELAELAYRMAIDAEPGHGAAGTGLGLVQLETRRYQEAEQQLWEVAVNGHGSWRTLNALGILADLEKDFRRAGQYYQRALEHAPGNVVVLNNLGYSRYLAADWKGARSALRKAVRSDHRYELAWRNLGLVHAREGHYEDALEALRRSGSEAEAYNDVGYIAMMDGRFSEAINFFQEAIRLAPTYYVAANENATEARRKSIRASERTLE